MANNMKKEYWIFISMIVFAVVYGMFFWYPIASHLDRVTNLGNPFSVIIALLILNFPTVVILVMASVILEKKFFGMNGIGTILLTLALFFGNLALSWNEPTGIIMPDGSVDTSAIGHSGGTDTFMRSVYLSAGVPQQKVFNYVKDYSQAILFGLMFLFGGTEAYRRMFD